MTDSDRGDRRSIILGHANTWHDPAIACNEGDDYFAEGIERHAQCKRALEMTRLWYSWRALKSHLQGAGGWPIHDADITALSSWSSAGSPALLQKPTRNPIAALLAGSTLLEPIYDAQLRWLIRGHPPRVFSPPAGPRAGVAAPANATFATKPVVHQFAHLANAVYTSPFEECVALVIDGYGEGTALSWFHFKDNQFELLHHESPEISLGLLYASVTQLCGFDPYQGEEWKVMGLAAFGEPDEAIYEFFKERLEVSGLGLRFRNPGGSGAAFDGAAWDELEKRAGGFRLPDDPDIMSSAGLAHNFQRAYTEMMIELVRGAAALGLSENLAISGGCALNSAANGRILANTDFERLHVPSAPGDDGNALGVVLLEKFYGRGEPRPEGVFSPYLGSAIAPADVGRILDFGGIDYRRIDDEDELCEATADLLAAGNIIAWVQGRAEFGPRALGNRSILGDPRAPNMKDRINERVKFREFYRPLAPVILDEHGPEYFEDYQQSPYMERTLTFRDGVRDAVPAVVHEDGTGRPQTVREEWNPLFHRLVSAFQAKTDVPVLLNTSFNVMGKPIVHTVQDAIGVLYTTGLDNLVIGPYVLSK